MKSNKELDDFTYVVSHDLKEPLRGVSAFSNFLKEEHYGNLDKEGKEYVDIIIKSSTRMKNLIDDLLELSRIGRGKNPISELSVLSALKETETELYLLIKEKNAKMVLPDKERKIICDRVRIKQVLTNLINNGIKFNRSEKPIIEVKFFDGVPRENPKTESMPRDTLTIIVKDNGIGIEKKHHDKVFDIFHRLVSREEFEGTGAGLTICKKIVQAHGGDIWFESEPGKGTTFYIALPINPHHE